MVSQKERGSTIVKIIDVLKKSKGEAQTKIVAIDPLKASEYLLPTNIETTLSGGDAYPQKTQFITVTLGGVTRVRERFEAVGTGTYSIIMYQDSPQDGGIYQVAIADPSGHEDRTVAQIAPEQLKIGSVLAPTGGDEHFFITDLDTSIQTTYGKLDHCVTYVGGWASAFGASSLNRAWSCWQIGTAKYGESLSLTAKINVDESQLSAFRPMPAEGSQPTEQQLQEGDEASADDAAFYRNQAKNAH